MIVGFTGTRKGMTSAQEATFSELLRRSEASMFVHGDCIGADADAHRIARELGVPVRLRPCNIKSQRAFCKGAIEEFPAEPPLIRNRLIVADSNCLFACPSGFEEELRSGTWATIRSAKKSGKALVIIWPDGSTSGY